LDSEITPTLKDLSPMPAEPATVEPKHALHAMTTYELRDYREDLETALSMQTLPPLYESREVLQQRLDAVLAKQEECARIAKSR
jgi:hypothetical protein